MNGLNVLTMLSEEYSLLYLDPDKDSLETYRRVVLRGEEPEAKSLARYHGSIYDRCEEAETPAGNVRVITLGDRSDFELVIRGMSAVKNGPAAPVPPTQGAASLTVFNWRKINSHLRQFPRQDRAAEFRRFTSVKDNYLDDLVVLSRDPYSSVSAADIGSGEQEWIGLSDTIRRYHELTHVICRRLYPDDIEPACDELIADAVGLYAAFGGFDPEKEELFLGIRDGRYIGGRLGIYTDDPEDMIPSVVDRIRRIREITEAVRGTGPFDMIPVLMEADL